MWEPHFCLYSRLRTCFIISFSFLLVRDFTNLNLSILFVSPPLLLYLYRIDCSICFNFADARLRSNEYEQNRSKAHCRHVRGNSDDDSRITEVLCTANNEWPKSFNCRLCCVILLSEGLWRMHFMGSISSGHI